MTGPHVGDSSTSCNSRTLSPPLSLSPSLPVDGDGTADFKVPRHPLIFYAKGMLLPVLLLLIVQCVFAAIFVTVETDESWTCNRRSVTRT